MWLFRVGWFNGKAALLKRVVSAGIRRYFNWCKNPLGFGLGWGKLSVGGLRNQYPGELFYHLQLTQTIAITQTLQLLITLAPNRRFLYEH